MVKRRERMRSVEGRKINCHEFLFYDMIFFAMIIQPLMKMKERRI